MTEIERWEQCIPVGRENAITRAELARLWNVNDRCARLRIAEIRAMDNGDDMCVVSTSDHTGYYRTDSLLEIAHFRNEVHSRANRTLMSASKAERILKEAHFYGSSSMV